MKPDVCVIIQIKNNILTTTKETDTITNVTEPIKLEQSCVCNYKYSLKTSNQKRDEQIVLCNTRHTMLTPKLYTKIQYNKAENILLFNNKQLKLSCVVVLDYFIKINMQINMKDNGICDIFEYATCYLERET